MTVIERANTAIRIQDGRSKLMAGGAALALLAGLGGVLIGRSTAPVPLAASTEAPVAQSDEGQKSGPEGFIAITPAQIAANGIAVERVSSGSIASEVIAQATITAPPEGQALVTARADGAITRINKRLGDPVASGETIALLESREAAAFVAERNAAAARAQAARAAAAREQRLFDAKVTAKQDLEAAVAARQTAEAELQRADSAVRIAGVTGNGRYLAVRSPIVGRITEVDTQLGAYVAAGAELFNVANPDRIQVQAAVPVPEAQRLQPGDSAVVELPGGGIVEARLRSITPSADPQSRAVAVVLQLAGAPGGLRQGQAVRVRITPRNSKTSGIILPEDSVQLIEGRDAVFVQVKGGFQAVPVQIGQRSGGRVEILKGLEAGQIIVSRGAFALKSQLGASEAEH
ncbi:efflux RND transporter periplasmic adaptor subunit [Sphingomonas astaxanthinifaciens]|uniref:Metal transporter n=1 Tax=Sphingomonas astaxanthinifaciens DSM 22298 TaxID=1123267 RepID=A0ABQ5Z851_9SPHN|nr:efflux RND transporter periplasmic adaptor subunit [Sphingomonas astaxanthinifaciens]GLR47641.1 metal transporter [Sphingomonas astaxanthinifaciens DSM 22298]